MDAPPEIRQLVERFQLHREAYRSAHYNETQVRREFVDPFFKALGWDVDNEQGYAEAYKDVIHEDALKFGGSTKAPDYCFRIGGVRKYFVETKRPSVNLKADPEPAYQLRRYAWSAKLPLSILTDFEELSVYNCRVRPQKTDKASKERVLYVTFDEYLDRWDEIAAVFSREAILRGAFDKYAESKKKRGTAEVDEAFLKEIEGWREVLARNLALRNPGLSQRELNYAVQKTIDRIIFLRICEDRGIEPADRLRGVTNGPNLYPRLCEVFRAADDRYNSGLFHFQSEKGRPEDVDEWTLALAVDDKPLKEIITGLYYPDSPYEFSVLPADILGQVYEQFLGKVIRLTKGHQARVEEKPEVRKAGGVYYTPTYIVDYIVENTVGKLLEGKTAYDVAARTKAWRPAKQGRPLAVLDPACGSGSFLIGAYQYLLDWYRDWYAANDPDHWLRLKEPTICETVPNLPSPSGRGAGGEGLPNLPSPSGRGAGGEGLPNLPSPSGRGAGGEGLSREGLATTPTNPPLPPDLLEFARQLRRRQTDAETLMWALLRNRRLGGLKFRRQHPVPPYVLDFYCHEAKLAIELDGGQHNSPDERARDERRSAFIREQGIRVLRFWNHDVLGDTDTVLAAIWNALPQEALSQKALSQKALTPSPSPGGRGGLSLPSPTAREAPNLPSPSGRGAGGEGLSREGLSNLPSPSGRGVGGEGFSGEGLAHDSTANYRLTTSEKKRILLDHIFGVDIDAQAVEVTKLSLLLKVLEGETRETLQRQLFARQRALPDLGANIKCGNSLIGPDFYAGRQLGMFDEEERYRINAFDWQREFPHIFASSGAAGSPGFDAVIGNPPYDVLEKDRGRSSWPHVALMEYVRTRDDLKPALGGKLNLFRFFLVRSLQLVRESGWFGNIIPLALLGDVSCASPRRHLFLNATDILCNCFPQKDNIHRRVFVSAKLSTMVVTCRKATSNDASNAQMTVRVYPWNTFEDAYKEAVIELADTKLLDPKNMPIPLVDSQNWELCKRIHKHDCVRRFGDVHDLQIHRGEINQTIFRRFISDNPKHARLLKGVEVGRYELRVKLSQGKREWFDEGAFLVEAAPKPIAQISRIATQRITGVDERLRIVATLADSPAYFADSTNSLSLHDESLYDLRYVLGLLNSHLFQWRFKLTSSNNNVGTNELESMPFRLIEFGDPDQRQLHDRLVELVDHMLTLHRQLAKARTGHEQTALRRQIESTDAEIDRLVYHLYGLTEDEIRIVEEAGAR